MRLARGAPRLGAAPAVVSLLAVAAIGAGAMVAPAAQASTPDEPVRLAVTAPRVVSLDAPTAISVSVASDPGAFDIAEAPVRLRVRLSPAECRDTFATTSGPVAIDQRLNLPARPTPALAMTLTGQARPPGFGVATVCAFVEEEGSDRLFASDTDTQVMVSQPCTEAGRQVTRRSRDLTLARRMAARAHRRAARARRRRARARRRRRARRLDRRVTDLARSLAAAQRTAAAACA